ncbi:lysozyme inhibitor LprI family protein [Kiloniella sp. EL199]|uniref:lysozyme inhibitor LprI family protein n=1 Tax=Kiloniella sp. EL199 TaxID=2107581 RepID=UPI000EA02CA8|nr:lysozyme inhibitor LprI family protein [Kiloniella sp. EL199]
MKRRYGSFLKVFSLLFVFTIFEGKAEESSKTLVVGELVYKEFHDPGYVYFQTEQGKKLEAAFYYRFITFEQIEKWTRGENFELVIDDRKGVGVRRKSDHGFFKVVFARPDNPIHLLEKACLDTAMTTLDIAGCYYQSAERWGRESDYLFRELSRSVSKAVLAQLSDAKMKWLAYEASLMDGFYKYGEEQGGSIMRIHNASLKSELSQSFFYQIVRFLE